MDYLMGLKEKKTSDMHVSDERVNYDICPQHEAKTIRKPNDSRYQD
jgi:hypothetical protein